MHTPRKIIYSEAMSPQRFAQECVLRAMDTILAHEIALTLGEELTDEDAEKVARQAERVGHAVAEMYGTPRMPD